MTQIKWTWFERDFDFEFPAEKMPDITERLRCTPLRTQATVENLDESQLHFRESENTWSVKENVAHISDLEPLWIGRIEDILMRAETMRAADLTNATTFGADHHACSIEQVLARVSSKRADLLRLIESLDPVDWSMSSLHPRLEKPMRIVDLCLFIAEHDDYHLARISYLKKVSER